MPVSKNLELAQLANGLDVNQTTGEVVTINLDTDVITEGTANLFFTNARADARIALATGANLDLTQVSIGTLSDVDITTSAPTNGQALIWNSANGEFEPGESFSQTDFDTAFAAKIATDITFGGNLIFEGATDDTNETTLTVVDPTADRTITLPNETGTVLLQNSTTGLFDISATNAGTNFLRNSGVYSYIQMQTSVSGTGNTEGFAFGPTSSGNVVFSQKVSNGGEFHWTTEDSIGVAAFRAKLGESALTLSKDMSLAFEGATDDANKTTVTVVDPTASRTITLPDATGTVALQNASIDMDGNELILDADGDTSIHSNVDDQIDVKIGGQDAAMFTTTQFTLRSRSSTSPNAYGLKFHLLDTTPTNGDDLGYILASGYSTGSNNQSYGRLDWYAQEVTAGSERGSLLLRLIEDGFYTNMWQSHSGLGQNIFYKDIKADTGVDIIFEGATGNNNETTLTVVDPTADRTITLPDATGTVVLTDSTPTLQGIDFNTLSSNPSYSEGLLWYSNVNHTLNYYADDSNVVHELGLEEHQRVYNNTGSTISKGQPLYFSGNYVSGTIDVPTVGLADATDVNKYNAQGIAASDIATGSYGYCLIAGQLHDVDTSGLNADANFFVGLTPGAVQNASPVYPNYPMCLGWVVKSDASTGILLVNQQNHSVNSFRVRTSAHIGSDLQVDGDLTVLGATTSVSTSDVTAGAPFYRANEGDAIGEAGTTFTGTGLDDAFFSGHFTGTTSTTYYVKIDSVGTPDTFKVSIDNFATTLSTNVAITGNKQLIHSADNIYVEFGATTGHTLNDQWTGVAGPVNVDTGFFSNRNTGTSGVGYTHVGLFFDISDQKWKLVGEYDPTPAGTINTGHASYSEGTLVAGALEGNLDFSYIQNKPDPQITTNLTGTVTGTGSVTLTDLQNGTLNIATTIPGTTNLTLADLTVTNLTVNGTQTINNQSNLTSDDPLFVLNANQVGEPDIGMVGAYNDGTAQYTGFFRDASDDKWKLFDGYTPSITSTGSINVSDNSFSLTTLAVGTLEGNVDWSYIQNKPDPVVTVTLTGEVTGTGNATLTDLTSGTISLATTIDPNADVEVNDLDVTGNLNVQGTTTTVNQTTLTVTDSKIFLADGNNADIIDIGTIFEYYDGSQNNNAGLFRDANDSGKFKFFSTYTPSVGTTIDTAHASFSLGTVVADTFEGNFVGNITGTISGSATSAATLTTPRTLWGQSFDGSANVTGDLTQVGNITSGSAIEISAGGTNQNVTLNPSGTGYTLLNGNVGIGISVPSEKLEVNGNILVNGNIQFEGATPDAFETTLAFTDPTSDRTITFPNSSGNVVVESSGSFTLEDSNLSSITLTETGGRSLEILVGAGAVPSVDNQGIVISDNDLQLRPRLTGGNVGVVRMKSAAHVEGNLTISSNLGDLLLNNNGTITTVTDSATQARTITLPDATGTVALTSDLTNYLSNIVEDTTPQLGGALDAQGNNITDTGNIELGTAKTISFEGSTANNFETTLTVTDPTADRTITLPDATGTVLLTDGDGSNLTGIISDIVGDTTPQLGGTLDAQQNNIDNVGRLEIGNEYFIDSLTASISPNTTSTSIASLVGVRGRKMVVLARNTTTGQTQMSEVLVVHDGSTAYMTEYGVVNTGTDPVVELDAGVSGANFTFSMQNPHGSHSISVKVSTIDILT